MSQTLDITKLKKWFLAEKRDLPWRQNASPYAIWISEIMLQQTQVAVVIPYFLRWMEQFPTIQALAEAPLDVVIKAWEGLGYYSRARHLHAGAQQIVAQFNGQLPSDEKKLEQIKGIGPYTIGALLSFAFHQKKAAVDGNVLRVLTRYFAIEDDIAKSRTQKKLRLLAENLLPNEEPWIVSEALIELGATICQRKARCGQCPLNQSCLAFREGKVNQLPVKSKGAQTQYLYRSVAVISCGEAYLIKRGEKGEIMSDLHEFPFFEVEQMGLSDNQLKKMIKEHLHLETTPLKTLPAVSHSFTRYQVRLDPVLLVCSEPLTVPGFQWMTLKDLKKLAFSSGHRRIFQCLLND